MRTFSLCVIVCVALSFSSLSCKKDSNPISAEQLSPILYGQVIDSQGNPIEGVGVHYIFDFPGLSLYKDVKTCPSTIISFAIPKRSKVTLKIFRWYTRDSIATLVDDTLNSGYFSVSLNNLKMTNGFYVCQIMVDTTFQERTIFLLDLDVSSLVNANPLTKTNSSGTFELPYALLGFGIPIVRSSPDGQSLDTVRISSTIKVVLCKTGYSPSVQTVTIDTTVGMRQTFTLRKL